MRKLRQTRVNNCGQTVLAMLADIDISVAEELMGRKGRTRVSDLVQGLKQCQLRAVKVRYKSGKRLPSKAVLNILWESGNRHWSIYHQGQVYDPFLPRKLSAKAYNIFLEKAKGAVIFYLKVSRDASN